MNQSYNIWHFLLKIYMSILQCLYITTAQQSWTIMRMNKVYIHVSHNISELRYRFNSFNQNSYNMSVFQPWIYRRQFVERFTAMYDRQVVVLIYSNKYNTYPPQINHKSEALIIRLDIVLYNPKKIYDCDGSKIV